MTDIEHSQDVLDPVDEPIDEIAELTKGLQLLEEYLASHPNAPAAFVHTYDRESARLAAMTTNNETDTIPHDPRHVGSGVTQLLFQ